MIRASPLRFWGQDKFLYKSNASSPLYHKLDPVSEYSYHVYRYVRDFAPRKARPLAHSSDTILASFLAGLPACCINRSNLYKMHAGSLHSLAMLFKHS